MSDDFHYEKLVILNNVYHHTLPPNDTFVPPPTITLPLYPHQKTLIHGMHQYRERMTRGFW